MKKPKNIVSKIIMKKVSELIPYVNNARTHTDKQVAELAASISELGFNDPIGLDGENGILEGHRRLLAALSLGMAEVPCMELSHLSSEQKRVYILAHNKHALNAGWDLGILLEETSALDAGLLDLAGFNQAGLDHLKIINEGGDMSQTSIFFEPEEKAAKKEKLCPHCGKKI